VGARRETVQRDLGFVLHMLTQHQPAADTAHGQGCQRTRGLCVSPRQGCGLHRPAHQLVEGRPHELSDGAMGNVSGEQL